MSVEEFQGDYRFLSNFWPAPIEYEGLTKRERKPLALDMG